MQPTLTQQYLKELLDYDPSSGIFTWKVQKGPTRQGVVAGSSHPHGYIHLKIDERRYLAHRLAWLYVHGALPTHEIDHINGVRNDNRMVNLREATSHQNGVNRGIYRNNSSGLKGVSWDKSSGKWIARIGHRGKRRHLGLFADIADAKTAYDLAAAEIYGEFVRRAL